MLSVSGFGKVGEKEDRKEEDQGVWTGAYEENGTFIEWSEY